MFSLILPESSRTRSNSESNSAFTALVDSTILGAISCTSSGSLPSQSAYRLEGVDRLADVVRRARQEPVLDLHRVQRGLRLARERLDQLVVAVLQLEILVVRLVQPHARPGAAPARRSAAAR